MGGIEVKAQFSVTDEGRIEGIAWPFGSPDRVGDVIEKGAFAGVVPPLPILASHADGDAVGVWDEITETAEGLAVKGRLLVNEVARAKEICALTREGALRGLSIGFKTLKALPRKGGGKRSRNWNCLKSAWLRCRRTPARASRHRKETA